MRLIRFKQHEFETKRNGKTVDAWEEYELVMKPTSDAEEMLDDFNKWLKTFDPEAEYDWDGIEKKQRGKRPDYFSCWCQAIGDYLVTNGWELAGSDSWDKAEVWIKK